MAWNLEICLPLLLSVGLKVCGVTTGSREQFQEAVYSFHYGFLKPNSERRVCTANSHLLTHRLTRPTSTFWSYLTGPVFFFFFFKDDRLVLVFVSVSLCTCGVCGGQMRTAIWIHVYVHFTKVSLKARWMPIIWLWEIRMGGSRIKEQPRQNSKILKNKDLQINPH